MTESKLVDEMKKVEDTEEEQSESPRGVLENPPISGSGSDSDNSSSTVSNRTSNGLVPVLTTEESSPIRRSLSAEARNNHGGSHWRNLICNIKSKSMRRFYSFPMWSGDLTFRKKLTRKLKSGDDYDDEIDCCGGDIVVPKPSWRIFSCQELAAATDDFGSEKLIGKGGHAEVYKGCLSDGEVVAVKRITKKGKNEEDRIGNFLSELGIIAHINHPNAAKLVGFSTDGGLHLLLDFSAHGSLASVLHGPCESLNWKMRLKIALGVAEGLQYLHSECPRRIIHRDITASNILLTKDYEPQISDFGLAKWLPDKWVHHVVYPIEGTFGYMAPEYFMHGIVNEKTDVFAFGVLLLELITGRRAIDSCRQSLVMWAKPLLEKNNVKDIADSSLEDSYDTGEMKRTMRIALACLNYLPSLRPYMNQVVQLLRGEEEGGQMELREKSSAGGRTVILDACDLEDYSSTTYMNDLDRHKQLVLE